MQLPYSNEKLRLMYLNEFQKSVDVPPGKPSQIPPELKLDIDFKFDHPGGDSILRLHYIVPPGHCSDIRLHVYIDGKKSGESPWLGPMAANKYEWHVKIGKISDNKHTLTLQPEGRQEEDGAGCNKGHLGRWGGIVALYEDIKR